MELENNSGTGQTASLLSPCAKSDDILQPNFSRRGSIFERREPAARQKIPSALFTSSKKPDSALTQIPVAFENTYRMRPKVAFPELKVKGTIQEALHLLDGQQHKTTGCGMMSKVLSSRIMQGTKQLNLDRYKLVCTVTIGSKTQQGITVASRCLWNTEFDVFVAEQYQSKSLFAVVVVYGVYLD